MPEGYCFKCKTKKEIANGLEETTKSGRKAIKGTCPTCGKIIFKFLGGKAAVMAGSTAPDSPANPATAASPTPQP
jgi:ribosomal protein S27E